MSGATSRRRRVETKAPLVLRLELRQASRDVGYVTRPLYQFKIKMAVQRKFIDKGLLKNVIRHTDAHNKVYM